MESGAEIPLIQPENRTQVWSVFQISMATFLAGPIGGCYLLSNNFKAFGKSNLSKKILLTGAIATIIVFGGLTIMPTNFVEKVPSMTIPAMYTILISSYAKKNQKSTIKESIAYGAKRRSYFKLILISASFFILEAFIFVPLNALIHR